MIFYRAIKFWQSSKEGKRGKLVEKVRKKGVVGECLLQKKSP